MSRSQFTQFVIESAIFDLSQHERYRGLNQFAGLLLIGICLSYVIKDFGRENVSNQVH